MPPEIENTISGEKVAQVLELAAREHSRIKITAAPDGFPFYSNIREIRQSQIYINAPEPPGMEDDILVDSPIDLFFPLHSRLYFLGKSIFLGIRHLPTEPLAYLLGLPGELSYQRERRVLRVVPSESMPITCLSIGGQPSAQHVKVKNLSQEGVCLSFSKAPTTAEGNKIQAIKLKFPGSTYLTLDGIVCYHRQDENGRYCVGLLWDPMTKPQFLAVRNYVRIIMEKAQKLTPSSH